MAGIRHLLTRPVGRPSYKPKVSYESFSHQAQSWDHPCGTDFPVVTATSTVKWHAGELSPSVGVIVTNRGGWSKIGMFERPHRYESRPRRPFFWNRALRLGRIAA